MSALTKFLHAGLVLPDEFYRDGECPRHIFIVGNVLVAAIQMIVQGT